MSRPVRLLWLTAAAGLLTAGAVLAQQPAAPRPSPTTQTAAQHIQQLEADLQRERDARAEIEATSRSTAEALARTQHERDDLAQQVKSLQALAAKDDLAAARQRIAALEPLVPTSDRIRAMLQTMARLDARDDVLVDAADATPLAARVREAIANYRALLATLPLDAWQAAVASDAPPAAGPDGRARTIQPHLKNAAPAPELLLLDGGCASSAPGGQAAPCIRNLAVSRNAISFDEFDAFARATDRALPADNGWGRGRRPVINVSFADAGAYAAWLRDQTGLPIRLPTEAEWVFAAGAAGARYPWGDAAPNADDLANCRSCGSPWDGSRTAPVGAFAPNPRGLFDMAGNVWQWTCSDGTPEAACPATAERRIAKGGSWFNRKEDLAIAARQLLPAASRLPTVGIRVVMTAGASP